MSTHHYVACDLGAESGRVMLGTFDSKKVTLEEIHRFPNGPVGILGSLRWDVLRIFEELKAGLRKVAARNIAVESISADSWGVDYVLLYRDEPMAGVPFHYRDARTDRAIVESCRVVAAERIFAETGLQFVQHNTLFQLFADLKQRPDLLRAADRIVGIGDYFNYLFSGVAKYEVSLASTTQLYNPRTRQWSRDLIEGFNFPARIFAEIVPSGTKLGPLLASVAAETNVKNAQVVATCSHDTGAAVAAIPAEGGGWAYLSSGTWSVFGVELPQPVIDENVRRIEFTNEVGIGHSIRFLKNIIGLWIVQECRRAWEKEGLSYNYEQLTKLAEQAAPFQRFIDPSDARFYKPDEMTRKVAAYCRETGQPPPQTPGEFVRCVLESLALLYDKTLREMVAATGHAVSRLHIVGGGSKNALLNQFTADAAQMPVYAGPVEATAIGNVLIQALALGHLSSHAELRRVVRDSFEVTEYKPRDAGKWREAAGRFEKVTRR